MVQEVAVTTWDGVQSRLLTPLQQTLQTALDVTLTALDEEDAVLLYRCTRIAEASPQLLEACDMRRTTLHQTLQREFQQLWERSNVELSKEVDAIQEGALAAQRQLQQTSKETNKGALSKARLASEMRVQMLLLEKDAEKEVALRTQAETLQRRWEAQQEAVDENAKSHAVLDRAHSEAVRQQSERQVVEMRKEVGKAEGRCGMLQLSLDKSRSEIAALDAKLNDARAAEREAKASAAQLAVEMDDVRQQMKRASKEVFEAQAAKCEMKAELADVKAKAERSAKEKAAAVEKLQESLSGANAQLRDMEKAADKFAARVSVQLATLRCELGDADAWRVAELAERRSEAAQWAAELTAYEAELTAARETITREVEARKAAAMQPAEGPSVRSAATSPLGTRSSSPTPQRSSSPSSRRGSTTSSTALSKALEASALAEATLDQVQAKLEAKEYECADLRARSEARLLSPNPTTHLAAIGSAIGSAIAPAIAPAIAALGGYGVRSARGEG